MVAYPESKGKHSREIIMTWRYLSYFKGGALKGKHLLC